MTKKLCFSNGFQNLKIVSFCLPFLVTAFSSHAQLLNSPQDIPEWQSRELIEDRTFKRRFNSHLVDSTSYTGTVGCVDASPVVWNVPEWHSNSTLLGMTPTTTGTGMCKFSNNYKDFRFGGPVGAEPYDIYFAVNSQAEYNNMYRVPGQPWPHLLVEQQLSPTAESTISGVGCPWVSMLRSLIFKVDAKLYYNQTIIDTGYNADHHAAQFLVYFTVQNLKYGTPGYGDYLFLGIPLYDDRQPFVSVDPFIDGHTQKVIYIIPFANLSSTSLQSGSWVSVNVDLLPYVDSALQAAWDMGKLTQSQNLADYKIGAMNMGWELPGMNISTVAVKNLSLVANTNQLFWGLSRESDHSLTVGDSPITIYPNPMEGTSINFSGKKIQTISIANCLGQQVLYQENKENNKEINVDLSTLPSGLYFSTVQTENGVEKIKFLKP